MSNGPPHSKYCQEIVRRHDKDRYLSSLFAPDDKRFNLWALYAFNYEISRIREAVSSPAAGEVRLQWWADALEVIYSGSPVGHPVAVSLAEAIAKGDLPKTGLSNMIEARRFDLYDDPMPSLNDLEGYLGETSSGLVQMASLLLAGAGTAATAAAAGYAGVAYGLTGLLRALPIHRARGQCYIPRDLLEAEGLTPTHILEGRKEPALARVLQKMRDLASDRLVEARRCRADIPAAALPAFLPLALVDDDLAAMQRSGLSMLDHVSEVPQWRRQWRLWRKARRREF
jgi:15-cis-phytoene synthase